MTPRLLAFDPEQNCRMFCHPIRTGLGEVSVRPINPSDAGLAQAFVVGLSGTSRYFRFFQALRCLSPAMLDRFTRVDHTDQIALVGIAMDRGVAGLVAEARFAVRGDGTSADIAVSVADPWQRHGIGTGLLTMLERIAGATGVSRLTGESLAVNAAFLQFARSTGFIVRPDAGDRSLVRIHKQVEGWSVW
jgi:acetyltransferase